jgi:hypothetical protein
MTLEAHAVAFVRDEDADYEALIMAEDESGAGARLEVQRALTVSEQDREAGLDTYALAVESGAVHYGGVQSWRGMDDAVAFELTDEAADDPVVGRLPERFDAFQWHYYTYAVPAGAVELARSEVCTQAFRLGDVAWAVQFHPEVTITQVEQWIVDASDPPPVGSEDALRTESRAKIGEWNALGRTLCGAFLEAAARVPA